MATNTRILKKIIQMLHLEENIQQKIREFVAQNWQKDTQSLILGLSAHLRMYAQAVGEQVQGKKKAQYKLPTWFSDENIVYPPALNMEQCSSEKTAKFKAEMVFNEVFGEILTTPNASLKSRGTILADLTGGFGVDVVFFAEKFEKILYFEQNKALFEVAKHNFKTLKINNIESVSENSIDFFSNNQQDNQQNNKENQNLNIDFFDCIYLDPARRNENAQKIAQLSDCEPNILAIKDKLFEKTNFILLKTSPMLDISKAVLELENVIKIWVVAVENECKEVLYLLKKEDNQQNNQQKTLPIIAVNFLKNYQNDSEIQLFESDFFAEKNTKSLRYSIPSKYLYEPNAPLMKIGCFEQIASHFSIEKIAQNSHLYTSEMLKSNFLGRIFEITNICKLDKKEILKLIPSKKANISVRNSPLSVEKIKEKIGLKDGGDVFMFVTTQENTEVIVIICRKASKE